ncbi:acyl-CoA dehydrogenase/oxidase [Plectosphaerella cucumerina]|uniref:Acyl-CoA dehydrogenase/oxidase n=1 Tax=Plectosphaerella cucumerina TaxID=40658 RepID=A0A8K0T4H9_9PEZI|nr:acyl-CoA dehydrogenase/oxidase [Plectosphaerella cucumerina]
MAANTSKPTPSSSTTGFFQSLPILEPQFTSSTPHSSDDFVLSRILRLYLPQDAHDLTASALHDLSREVLQPSVLRHLVDAEINPPTLQPLTTFGEVNRTDALRTSEGWRALKAIGIAKGVVSTAYDKSKASSHNRRVEQFAIGHVWSHSAAVTMCPMTMTDGAATLLSRHLDDPDGDQPGRRAVFEESFRRLTSSDPAEAWTSGQWMTERSGGSDVSGTETLARRLTAEELASDSHDKDAMGLPLGPWRVDGFKWFSSATDSEMTVLLARTAKGGLSAFYMPMRRATSNGASELNGVRIQRLKNKMGTRALPTAELEMVGARAWLLGDEGKGVKAITALLNITRVHSAAGSASYWARGMAICRAFSRARRVRGRLLCDNAQHVAWMARETVRYHAATQFVFLGIALLGCSEQGPGVAAKAKGLLPQDEASVGVLLRLLTPVIKAQVTQAATNGLRQCMECLGGVGYCENNEDGGVMNVARLFRDSVVDIIWEGTVSVMAEDVGRVLKNPRAEKQGDQALEVFISWAKGVLKGCRDKFPGEVEVVSKRVDEFVSLMGSIDGVAELEYHGRQVLDHLEVIATASVLLYDACTDGDEVTGHIVSRYVWMTALPESQGLRPKGDWKKDAVVDRKIFLGADFVSPDVRGRL